MAYDVNKKDGTLLVTVADGSVDDSQSTIKLLGRGVTNYGEIMAENLVWMLEHFANTTSPSNPIDGQLWFDTSNTQMKVRHSGSWNPIGGVTVSSGAPAGTFSEGDLWWDSDDDQLYARDDDGSQWVLVGPTSSDPNIAQDAAMIGVNLNPGPGQMILVIINGVVVAGWADQAYTPVDYAANAGTIVVGGTNVLVDVPASFPSGVQPGCNLSPIISGNVFNGTAITAQYADIAERYHADAVLDEGDVVRIGGTNEVTKTATDLDLEVFGVVSASPAVRMNASAGDDSTHPYIGLAGRLPVKVNGSVSKGQRLVSSAIPGVARAATPLEASDYILAVFGRALEDKTSPGVGLVEAVIGTK